MNRPVPPRIHQVQANVDPSSSMHLPEDYQFIQLLGKGTQGKVCLAKRKRDGLYVAIKQLNIESVKNWKEYELFRREADVLASLNVTGVAKFYEAIECLEDDPPCSYIVQEYINGSSIARLMQTGHRFSIDQVYSILIQLLQILQELHAHVPPVIHRDIKPSNILVKPNGDGYLTYLIDFGAVANPKVQGGGSTVAGTFGYMPPEQLMGNPVPASDIYALAAVAVHLMSGRSPAEMPVKDFHLIFEPDLQNMPVVVVNTLRKMLEPKVENRLCDIPTLIQLFSDFKKSIYQIDKTQDLSSMSADEYNEALEKVQSFAEPGTIELWQRLHDETPREIPDVYHNLKMDKRLQTKGEIRKQQMERAPKVRIQLSDYTLTHENADLKVYLLVFLVVYPFFLIAGAVTSAPLWFVFFLLPMTGMWPNWPMIIGVLIILIAFYLFLRHFAKGAAEERHEIEYEKYIKEVDWSSIRIFTKEQYIYYAREYKKLLTYGRKAIATITNVSYIPVQSNITQKGKILCVSEPPQFRIQYKFNPPDDLREEDLYFHLFVRNMPEQEYQIGDPFPILYLLNRTENNLLGRQVTETVSAMPFPVPPSELDHIETVLHIDRPVSDYPDEAKLARVNLKQKRRQMHPEAN